MYTLNFTAKMYLYGPVTSQVKKLLREFKLINIQILMLMLRKENKELLLHLIQQTDADDNFGFNEEHSFFQDADVLRLYSGTDKDN